MDLFSKLAKKVLIFFILVFMIGILNVIYSRLSPLIYNWGDKIDTVAIITKVEVIHDDDDTDYYNNISYLVNGEIYQGRIVGSSEDKVGDEFDVYYFENNPQKVSTKKIDKNENNAVRIISVIEIILLILLIKTDIKLNKEKEEYEKEKENSIIIYADFVNVSKKNNEYYINCKWENPDDEKTYQFISEPLDYDPTKVINMNELDIFPVKLNKNDFNKYLVSVSAVCTAAIVMDLQEEKMYNDKFDSDEALEDEQKNLDNIKKLINDRQVEDFYE